MRPLNLDFIQSRPFSLWSWGVLVSGLAVLVLCLLAGLGLAQKTAQLRYAAGLLAPVQQSAPKQGSGLSAAEQREQTLALAEMQRVSAQLQRPWERLLNTLEQLPREDVALLSLNCSASRGQLRVSAEARNLEAMLALHQQLEQSNELSDVSLLNHEVINRPNERAVMFNLLADWEVQDARL